MSELLAREEAKSSLLKFATYTKNDFQPAKHHAELCAALEDVEAGRCDRLMVFMPPRHTKSELASRRFPAWFLGRNPQLSIITASYGSDLATDFGREVRNIVGSDECKAVFPELQLAADSQAANRWHTGRGGQYFAVGVGSALTGRGGHLILVDDPHKDRAEADSETMRERVWGWYRSTLYTRLMPGGRIVLIQTRWHDDDLAGRILAEQRDEWRVVEMPAISPAGEALWPEWWPREVLDRIRKAIGEREFSALYQQRPQPEEGTFFRREWFEFYDPAQQFDGHRYVTADYAVTEGDGDWSEIATHVYAPNGVLYLAKEAWRGQTTADVWIDKTIDQFKAHRPLCFFAESGVIRRATEPFLRRRMQERSVYCRTEWITRSADKPAMARPLQAMASMGKVKLPDNEYGHHLLAQLLAFPAGKHDDAVDMAALMALAIADAHPAIASAGPEKPKHVDRWAKVFDRSDDKSWRTA